MSTTPPNPLLLQDLPLDLSTLPPDDPAAFVPPPPPLATATLTPGGVLHLHTSLRQSLRLCPGQPINLLPPSYNSLYWHLDLRPTATRTVSWRQNTQMRVSGIKLPPGLVTAPLTLYLMPGQPLYPHCYPLLPENAPLGPPRTKVVP